LADETREQMLADAIGQVGKTPPGASEEVSKEVRDYVKSMKAEVKLVMLVLYLCVILSDM